MLAARTLLPRQSVADVLEAILLAEISCEVLLAALLPEVRQTLPIGPTPAASLYQAVHHLNRWTPLDGEESPLCDLLRTARSLMGPRRERAIVESALADLADGTTAEQAGARNRSTRDFFYKRARDSFEASGCTIMTDSLRSDTFIAYRGTIVSVVAVCVASLDHVIRAVKDEVRHVARFEPYVEGCIVLSLEATTEQRRLVEGADLRVIEAKELQGMNVEDVEAVVRAQLGELGDADHPGAERVESAYQEFRASAAHLLAITGREADISIACRRFVRARAVEMLDRLGDCAPLWLVLTEPLPPRLEELAIPHFRKNGVRCSSLGLRHLMNERLLLPVFEATSLPRRRGRPAHLVGQALTPPARAVLFTATDRPTHGAELMELFQVSGAGLQALALRS
jgi:hypothetical protein